MFRTLPVLLLATIMLAACSPAMPTPLATPNPPTFGESWTIEMNQSGGIMGLSRSIEISSDGKYTVTDEHADKTIEGQLSTNELAQVQELVKTLEPAKVTSVEQTGCADCFVYTIVIQGEGKSSPAQVNDITLKDSGFAPLVTFLTDIMETSLE
jgi:hypothetical protein